MLPIDLDSLRLFLHVLAACIWVGGQIVLGALVPVLRRASPEAPGLAARQFGRVGWTAFAVLILTGFWNIAEYADKDRPGYAGTMAAKLTFVALSGIAAYIHTRARSRALLAAGGAGAALFALAALFLGVVLSD